MRSDPLDRWLDTRPDDPPDLTLVVPRPAVDTTGLARVAAHLEVRRMTWELIVVGESPGASILRPADVTRSANVSTITGPADDPSVLGRAFESASGTITLLVGGRVSTLTVELDRFLVRLRAGADIVVGRPRPGGDGRRALPALTMCRTATARALADAQVVYGRRTFADLLCVAGVWGLELSEIAMPDVRGQRSCRCGRLPGRESIDRRSRPC